MSSFPEARSIPVTTGILVAAYAVIVGVVVGLGWLVTHPWESSVESFDDGLARWLAGERTSSLSSAAEVGTFFGDTLVSVVVSPIVAIAFWVWQRSVRPALFVALVVLGIGGIYAVATHFIPRDRPPVKILDPGLVPTHSFPSGHVGTATALYGLIVVLVWTYLRMARWWAAVLALLPVLVLVARLYQGAHHLTDVLTSVAYTTAWLFIVARLTLPGDQAN